jgi:hypothetical protein
MYLLLAVIPERQRYLISIQDVITGFAGQEIHFSFGHACRQDRKLITV